jgi:hypothetical protein
MLESSLTMNFIDSKESMFALDSSISLGTFAIWCKREACWWCTKSSSGLPPFFVTHVVVHALFFCG